MSQRTPLQLIVFVFGLAALLALLYTARWIAVASLIGVGVGTILIPPVTALHRKARIPRGLCAGLAALLMLGGFAGISYLLAILVSEQLVPALNRLPDALQSIQKDLGNALGVMGGAERIERSVQQLNLGQFIKQAASALLQGIRFSAVALGGALFVIALGGYLSADPDRYKKAFLSAFPSAKRLHVSSILSDMARTLRRWFLAQLVSMATVGLLTAVAFWTLGVDYWPLIGVLSGILEFVPYIGPILAALAAAVVTLGADPQKLIWVLVIFTAIQQLEGMLITPVVMRWGINLPPVHLLIFVLAMTTWFGLLGTFSGPPLFAVLRTVYLRTFVDQGARKAAA